MEILDPNDVLTAVRCMEGFCRKPLSSWPPGVLSHGLLVPYLILCSSEMPNYEFDSIKHNRSTTKMARSGRNGSISVASAIAAALLFACVSASPWAQPAPELATPLARKQLVTARHFMVVAAHPLAAPAGYA